jgi:Ca2+-binding EF-hand superfamily protein
MNSVPKFILVTATLGVTMLAMAAQARPSRDPVSAIMRADSNRDGMVTKQELVAFRTANFDQFDRNKDGVLSQSDVPNMARFAPGFKAGKQMAQFDANGDKKVTREEFVNRPMAGFDRADMNKDGVLTKAEATAAAAAAKR